MVLSRFWLGNMLRLKTECKFSSFVWPAGSACALSKHLLAKSLQVQGTGPSAALNPWYPVWTGRKLLRYQKPSSSTVAEVGKQSFVLISLQNLSWVYEIRSGREIPFELGRRGRPSNCFSTPTSWSKVQTPVGNRLEVTFATELQRQNFSSDCFFPKGIFFFCFFASCSRRHLVL